MFNARKAFESRQESVTKKLFNIDTDILPTQLERPPVQTLDEIRKTASLTLTKEKTGEFMEWYTTSRPSRMYLCVHGIPGIKPIPIDQPVFAKYVRWLSIEDLISEFLEEPTNEEVIQFTSLPLEERTQMLELVTYQE